MATSSSLQDITVIKVADKESGFSFAKQMIYANTNTKSALFLSGGLTPKNLYEQLAKEKKLKVGAVALVDERYGESFHPNSNEAMIKQTGLLSYLKTSSIPFYGIIQKGESLHDVADSYGRVFENLVNRYTNRVAILGIGADSHTAGIPAGKEIFERLKINNKKTFDSTFGGEDMVVGFDDPISIEEGGYGSRVTLTFSALSKMNRLFIIVLGDSKKKPLHDTFQNGPLIDSPARFYRQPDVSEKTLLITDQNI